MILQDLMMHLIIKNKNSFPVFYAAYKKISADEFIFENVQHPVWMLWINNLLPLVFWMAILFKWNLKFYTNISWFESISSREFFYILKNCIMVKIQLSNIWLDTISLVYLKKKKKCEYLIKSFHSIPYLENSGKIYLLSYLAVYQLKSI